MSDNQTLLNETLTHLGLHAEGEAISPEEGLIASNFFVETAERGKIVIRANELGENTSIGFEVRALDFLAQHDAPVPTVIPFTDNAIEKHLAGKRVIAYVPIEGDTLSADELNSPALASEAGNLLGRIIEPSEQYSPVEDEPDGDVTFIRGITEDFLTRYPDLKDARFFNQALSDLSSEDFADALKKSPQGIVHADFFYENIIKRDGKLVGVIDFGDAYYGALVTDIAIGAMEFSVLEGDEQWKPELFEAFLGPHAEWLRNNNISFDTFQNVLLINCLRFAVYTLGFEREDDPLSPVDQNRYVQRYFKFKETLSAQLRQSFENVCG